MLLVDENISYRVCRTMQELYPSITHVTRALTRDADARITDAAIWAHAREHGLVILTRDHDFTMLAREDEAAPPPHVVRLCLGNCRRQEIEQVLREYHTEIVAHAAQIERVELRIERDDA